MKIIDGIKLKGSPAEIPNCSRNDLPVFFKEMGYKVGAEIGVYRGDFSKKIAEVGLKHYAIDPWREYGEFVHNKGQARLDYLYDHTKNLLSKYPDCTVIRKSSMEAINDFENESLDFVYIDANHEFRYIAEDLYEWTKKVKRGGTVSGHDYFFIRSDTGAQFWHVAHVLKAYVAAFGIPNWHLIGRNKILPGEIRDKWRSWMFVKP